jgi:hypothetical protein
MLNSGRKKNMSGCRMQDKEGHKQRRPVSQQHLIGRVTVAGQMSVMEPEPEFLQPLENHTVTQGRDVFFTCVVNHLGPYKVRVRRGSHLNTTKVSGTNIIRIITVKWDGSWQEQTD